MILAYLWPISIDHKCHMFPDCYTKSTAFSLIRTSPQTMVSLYCFTQRFCCFLFLTSRYTKIEENQYGITCLNDDQLYSLMNTANYFFIQIHIYMKYHLRMKQL